MQEGFNTNLLRRTVPLNRPLPLRVSHHLTLLQIVSGPQETFQLYVNDRK